MKDFLIRQLKIPSVSGDEEHIRKAMEMFAKEGEEKGFEVEWSEAPLYLIVGRGDLYKPEIGFLCHLDVVPPFFPPRIEEDRVYGRGSIDMKGPTVACFFGMLESDHPDVAMAFTPDEEVDGNTAAYLSTVFIPEKVLICPDQNRNFDVNLDSKGIVEFRVFLGGRTAHGSTPWDGDNAVEKAMQLFEDLKIALKVENEPGWHNTLNLASINSDNVATNVVPDNAMASFDLRFAHESVEHWEQTINEVVEKHEGELHIISSYDRIHVEETGETEMWLAAVEQITGFMPDVIKNNSTCDARFYAGKVPTVIMTKNAGGFAHAPDEYVSYDSCEHLRNVTRIFLERMREKRIQ